MIFKLGKVLEEFEVEKKGKKLHVVFRYLKMSDMDGLLHYINSLVREGALIGRATLVKRKDEMKWIRDVLKEIKEGNAVHVVAEADGKLIASASVKKDKYDVTKHIADVAIGTKKDYRSLGIGTKLLNTLLKLAKKELKCEIAMLWVFSNNKAAKHVYEKCGFREVGRIKDGCKRKGKYYDDILMTRRI